MVHLFTVLAIAVAVAVAAAQTSPTSPAPTGTSPTAPPTGSTASTPPTSPGSTASSAPPTGSTTAAAAGWTQWVAAGCSSSCGYCGFQLRARICNGGACTGSAQETTTTVCNPKPCPAGLGQPACCSPYKVKVVGSTIQCG